MDRTDANQPEDAPTLPTGGSKAAPGDAEPEGSRSIGHYRLIRSLGRGAQGEVWLAEDIVLRRKVALKILSRALGSSPSEVTRFQREAAAASKLDHPSICSVYEAGEADGVPYIAMRYVNGETLSRRLASARSNAISEQGTVVAGRTPVEEPEEDTSDAGTSTATPASRDEILRAVGLIEKTARALHVAHEAGLIHRDIKPGNIMITPADDPVILDFGLARDEESQAQTLTLSGDLLGTPAYMSPEQLLAQRIQLDRRTDIYSLGVTLYECVTLRRPFDAPTRDALYQQILTGHPPDPRRLNSRISTDLKVIIETAIEKDRNRRYQTARDFAEDLRRFRTHEPILARPAGPILRFSRWVQRNPVVATATLGLFLVLLTGLVISLVLYSKVKDERDRRDQLVAKLEVETADKTHALAKLERALADRQTALGEAQRERDKNSALYLTAKAHAVLPRAPGTALLLGVESAKRHPNHLTNRLLIDALDELREERTLDGHRGPLSLVKYSPDGRLVLTCGDAASDRTSRVWNAATGELLAILGGHQHGIRSAAFSPDGSLVATGSDDVRAWVRETATGRPVTELVGHEHWATVNSIAFSADGLRVVTASDDATARVWEARTGRLIATLDGSPGATDPAERGHECAVATAVFSPDGTRVLTGSTGIVKTFHRRPNGTIYSWSTDSKFGASHARVWDAETGSHLLELGENLGSVDARFSDDGSSIICASQTGLKIWDASDGTLIADSTPFAEEKGALQGFLSALRSIRVDHTVLSRNGRFLVLATSAGEVQVLRTSDGERLAALTTGHPGFSAIAIDDAGQRLLTVPKEGDNNIELRDATSGDIITVLRGHDDTIVALAFHPDGTRAISASTDGTARIWNTGEISGVGRHVEIAAARSASRDPMLSPDGERAVIDGRLLIDTETGTVLKELVPALTLELFGRIPVDHAFFATDSSRIMTHSRQGHALAFDAETGDPKTPLLLLERRFIQGAFSPDGKLFIDPSPGGSMRAIPMERDAVGFGLEGHTARVVSLSFSADSTVLLSGSEDGTLRVWDLAGRREALKIDSGMTAIDFVVLSARAARALAVERDGGLRIWDGRSGEPAGKELPIGEIRDARFSPDGELVLAVSRAGQFAVFTPDQTMLHVGEPQSPARGACFDADGRRLLTIHENDSAVVWSVDRASGRVATVLSLAGHRDRIASASFSPDGALVLTASVDGTARLWDATSGATRRILRGHERSVLSAAFSPDGSRIVTSSLDDTAIVWDTATGKRLRTLEQRQMNILLGERHLWFKPQTNRELDSFSAHSSRLLTVTPKAITIWDAATGESVFSRNSPPPVFTGRSLYLSGNLSVLSLSDDGRLVLLPAGELVNSAFPLVSQSLRQSGKAFALFDHMAREVWNVDAGARVSRLSGDEGGVVEAAFSPDGRLLVVVDRATQISIHDVATGAWLRGVAWNNRSSVPRVLFSPDGQRLFVHGSSSAALFGVATGNEIASLASPAGGVVHAAFSPDGELLATAESDRTVRLWNADGTLAASLGGHLDDLRYVDFDRSGARLATASETEVTVWDVASRAAIISVPPLEGVRSVRFSSDGASITVLHATGIFRWPLDVLPIALSRTPRELTPDEAARHEVGTARDQEAFRLTYQLRQLERDFVVLRRHGLPDVTVRNELASTLDSYLGLLENESPGERTSRALQTARSVVERVGPDSPRLLATLAGYQARDGHVADAVRTLERAAELGPLDVATSRRLRSYRDAVWPDLVSYASIDAAVDREIELIREGDTWKFFRGHGAPSPGLEWTAIAFDDSRWESGASGFGYGDGPYGTVIDDMRDTYTTLYLRREFDIDDPQRLGSLRLSVQIDDGFVAYLNGSEIGRVGAGTEAVPGHTATADRTVTNGVHEELVVPATSLVRGRNVLAVLGLNASRTSSDLTVTPSLAAEPVADVTRDRARFAEFLSQCDDRNRVEYLDGCLFDRVGRHDAAVEKFRAVASRDQSSPQPVSRLARSLAASESWDESLAALNAAFRDGLRGGGLVDLWFEAALLGVRKTPVEALDMLPAEMLSNPGSERARNVLETVRSLSRNDTIRINCGGDQYVDSRGRTWSADRFQTGGFRFYEQQGNSMPYAGEIHGTEDDMLYATERWFDRPSAGLPGYRVPVPPGEYRVTLHFAELVFEKPNTRRFTVVVESSRVTKLVDYEPVGVGMATADARTVDVRVDDGRLDIEFVHGVNNPKISAIEIELLRLAR